MNGAIEAGSMGGNPNSPGTGRTPAAWLPVLAGLLLIYVPTFADLLNGIWKTDRNAHGPIVLAVSMWFLWFRLRQLLDAGQILWRPAPRMGAGLLAFGLLCYVLGRSQGVHVLEVGSFIPVLAACVLMFFGPATLGRLWFSFFFMLFFIPLPATLVDAITQPLKLGVSYATEHLLYALGYPIAREGVILTVGQYQLLVADACAGLHSLFTLEALGLLYMNIVGHQSVIRNITLAAFVVPISFASNVLRVIALTLITYYLGDAAGQGFLHGFAGMLLFLSALLMIIGVDSAFGVIFDRRSDAAGTPGPRARRAGLTETMAALAVHPKGATAMGLAMALTVASTYALKPEPPRDIGVPDLAAMVPARFGGWVEVPSPFVQVDLANGEDLAFEKPYEAVLMRTYANAEGHRVMLALAYARQQNQEVRMHRPEACYEAMGFQIISYQPADFSIAPGATPLPGVRLLTRKRDRIEPVSYWIRVGDKFPRGGFETRLTTFRQGLAGRVPDGMLVRVSSIQASTTETDDAYRIQQQFFVDLLGALQPPARRLLAAIP